MVVPSFFDEDEMQKRERRISESLVFWLVLSALYPPGVAHFRSPYPRT